MWILVALAAATQMGQISFPVSGNAQCKQRHTAGMLAMHSFMYDRARDEFKAASKADPRCAMARWGEAMSYVHPIWGDENLPESRKALAAIVDEASLPQKERAYLETARGLFGEGDTRARFHGWRLAAERMHRDYPSDDEVALQLALALMADSDHFKDTRALMQAAALAQDVFARRPQHPGAAHYVIHAFDTPDHAILGLPAAERYAKIAPAASHALHMPSHIFVQLGMWERVQRSNVAAWAASEKDSAGKSIEDYDWHTYSWLMASAIELGQHKRAGELLAALRDRLAKQDNADPRFSYSLMVHLYAAETGAWDQLDALLAPLDKALPAEPGDKPGSLGCAQHAPGGALPTRYPVGLVSLQNAAQLRAVAASVRGDEAAVKRAIDEGHRIDADMKAWSVMLPPNWMEQRAIFGDALVAIARARKTRKDADLDKAVELLGKLGAKDRPYSGPAFDSPTQQLLGDLYAACGKPAEALVAYEKMLKLRPRTSHALLGAARAAMKSAQPSKAQQYYAELAELWKNADGDLPALDEVRRAAPSATRPLAAPSPQGRRGAP
jgi:tetratricopeptide (TPR) repeat protein